MRTHKAVHRDSKEIAGPGIFGILNLYRVEPLASGC